MKKHAEPDLLLQPVVNSIRDFQLLLPSILDAAHCSSLPIRQIPRGDSTLELSHWCCDAIWGGSSRRTITILQALQLVLARY